ncbi:MAG TPA: hypothetical protein VFY14_20250 [Streptomyces sp.]|nr:hypothetical protein [Streptomyces sp.]
MEDRRPASARSARQGRVARVTTTHQRAAESTTVPARPHPTPADEFLRRARAADARIPADRAVPRTVAAMRARLATRRAAR